MAAKLPMTNFSKGEFAPKLYARTDIPQYNAGARKVLNFVIMREGGLAFRSGFRFVGEVNDFDDNHRMAPFLFSQDQAYVMTLSDFKQELLAQGGFVVEEDLQIVSYTNEAQTILEIPYHAFAVGDRLFLDGNTGPALNERFVNVVEVIDANHVRVDLDTTGMAALTASTGIVRVGAPTPPPDPPDPLPEPEPEPDPPVIGGGGGSGGGLGGGWGGNDGGRNVN